MIIADELRSRSIHLVISPSCGSVAVARAVMWGQDLENAATATSPRSTRTYGSIEPDETVNELLRWLRLRAQEEARGQSRAGILHQPIEALL